MEEPTKDEGFNMGVAVSNNKKRYRESRNKKKKKNLDLAKEIRDNLSDEPLYYEEISQEGSEVQTDEDQETEIITKTVIPRAKRTCNGNIDLSEFVEFYREQQIFIRLLHTKLRKARSERDKESRWSHNARLENANQAVTIEELNDSIKEMKQRETIYRSEINKYKQEKIYTGWKLKGCKITLTIMGLLLCSVFSHFPRPWITLPAKTYSA